MANTEALVKKAEIYKEYIQGWAYIPLQDVPIYENAFNTVYGK